MDKKEQASYAKTRSNKLQTQRKMVYKTGSRNNIPIYWSAVSFSETTRQRDFCFARLQDNESTRQRVGGSRWGYVGQRTTDNGQRRAVAGCCLGPWTTDNRQLVGRQLLVVLQTRSLRSESEASQSSQSTKRNQPFSKIFRNEDGKSFLKSFLYVLNSSSSDFRFKETVCLMPSL